MKEQYTEEFLSCWADRHKVRTLDEAAPELRPYLKPGAMVLDVGCGVGSITLDVAQAVDPGEVVGVDPVEHSVLVASQLRLSHSRIPRRPILPGSNRQGSVGMVCRPGDGGGRTRKASHASIRALLCEDLPAPTVIVGGNDPAIAAPTTSPM